MPKPPLPLTALSEAQRTQALERFVIIRLQEDKLARPSFTTIEADYRRAIAGLQEPTALTTALTLRQALCCGELRTSMD